MKNLLNVVAIMLLLVVTGCGSLSSHWRGGSGVYQGVRFDCAQVTQYSTESEVIAALDIPLSAVVDTFFLPYDLSTGEKSTNQIVESDQAASVSPRTGRVGHKY